MAKVTPTWGIDIGQCAIKALRCVASEDEPGKMVAEAFDYIEYPKILSVSYTHLTLPTKA